MTARGASIALFEERLAARPRDWWWLLVAVVVTAFALGPLIAPLTFLAWLVNVIRYRRTVVRIEPDAIRVGRRCAPLAALDLPTVGRATNTWPWRAFSRRHLGANPIWTRDSVGLQGRLDGRRLRVSVGTNRRDELLATLDRAVREAHERLRAAAPLPPPGWHPDPWSRGRLRWWDGTAWSGWTWPRPPGGPT